MHGENLKLEWANYSYNLSH